MQRIVREERFGSDGVWVDNVDMPLFFVNRFKDPRGWDINLVGQLHDLSFPEVVHRFGGGSGVRAEYLRRLFSEIDSGCFFLHSVVGRFLPCCGGVDS